MVGIEGWCRQTFFVRELKGAMKASQIEESAFLPVDVAPVALLQP
jgi:hypothetical protein